MTGILNLLLANAITRTDPYFNYTTLLLPGNGTNGGQNNTFLDSSSNNFSITRNGNTTQGAFTPFQQNGYWSNYFDGSGDYLSVADNAALEIGASSFSIEAWIYLDALPSSGTSQVILSKWVSGNYSYIFQVNNNSGTMRFSFSYSTDGSSGTDLFQNASITAGTWHHVAITRNSTTVRFFLNGVQQGGTQTANATFYNGAAAVEVGRNGDNASLFKGYISNCRLVVGSAVYTADFTPSTAPLTAITNTSLLTCQSNRFIDNSANQFTITVNGNTSVQAFSPFLPTAAYSAATNGGSGYFDGNSDYVDAGSNAAWRFTSTTSFTVEMWLYVTANNKGVVSAYAGSGGWVIGIGTDSGTGTFNVFDGVAWQAGYGPDIRNQWAHCVFTSDAGSAALFVNGSRTRTWTLPAGIDPGSNANLYVGSYTLAGSPFYVGNISGFRIVKGSYVYNPASSTLTVPTSPPTNITNTSILLNFTNAAIIDNTAKNDLETVGNAQISTTQSKFGGGSIAFDGSGDYLVGPMTPNLVFSSGDMTFECWIYANTISGFDTIFDTRTSGGYGNESFSVYLDGGIPKLFAGSYSGGSPVIAGSSAISTATWTHIAFTRSSGTNYLFVNGTSITSNSNSWNQTLVTTNNFRIGEQVSGDVRPLDGYIDDLRITKGIARYTSSFTPPSAAFPLS